MQNNTPYTTSEKLNFILNHQLQSDLYCIENIYQKNLILLADKPLAAEQLQKIVAKSQRQIQVKIIPTDKFQTHITQQLFALQYQRSQQVSPLNDHLTVTLCNTIMNHAITQYGSDIHIEPFRQHCRIRFRIDGLLKIICTLPSIHIARITARFKILAQLDTAEKRHPQDGRFAYKYQTQRYDCRVNSCPCQFGEKIVIRILNHSKTIFSLDELGLNHQQSQIVKHSLQQAQGLILVTGPTGSGKTQTLYSLLQALNTSTTHILTIEDPIEIELNGITQIQTQSNIGLDFSTLLRTVLRQDPDIIMLGEIRDKKTATMALRAANTGHLVLATLHTNNAYQAITRLTHMGIAHYHIAQCLNAIIAQRLLRKCCMYCNTNPIENKASPGCEHCQQGYRGRIGVFEIIPQSEALQHCILQQDWHALSEHQKNTNLTTLWQSAQTYIEKKITTLTEAYRVIQHEE